MPDLPADDTHVPAREYPAVWAYLLRLCWRHEPWRATMAVLVLILGVFTFGASAVAVRVTIDSSSRGLLATAVVAAAVAGLGYSLDLFVNVVGFWLQANVAQRVALTVLDDEILRDINDVEGVEHLERPEYLDRLAMLAGSKSELMDSAWALVHTICYAARLGVSLLLLGSVNPVLLSLLLFAAAPVWLDNRASRAQTRAVRRTTEALRVEKHLFGLLTGAAPGKEIRVNGVAGQLIAVGKREWNRAHTERFRVSLIVSTYRIAGWTIFIAGFGFALATVIHDALRGRSTPGDVVLTISVAAAMRHTVGSTVQRSTRTAGAARLIQPYLWLRRYADADRRRARGADPVPDRLTQGIDLEHVVYRYPGTERNAVDGVTAHLPAGSVIALVGEYGSGKTTLVKLLSTLYRPQSGTIRIDGTDLSTLDGAAWRSRLSAAFQDFGRYHTVLREVVGLGEPAAMNDPERIEAALSEADATELVRRLPDGLDTRLGQQFGGVELSDGQWQKTALARSCMRTSPLLLLLDEPTASLDAPSEHAVFTHYMTRARALAGHTGAVTVVVSHRFSTVADADLILVMDSGRLIESGSHAELLERGGQYATLYGISAASYAGLTPRP
jgi:ABC-type multidrug transport system fused ATPase/permease subunit